jgi:hypothetical protein
MVDGVAAASASASASASETTAEHSRDSGNATVQALDLELTRPASVHKTHLPDDRSRPAEAVSEETTPASEDVEEKPVFRDETAGDAIRKAEIVALDCISKPYPLEEFVEEERTGWWSPDRIGIVMRCLWVFLAATLVVGVTGVYLTQTGRFGAIEFSKRWLALLSGEESTLPQNDPLELGLVEGRPSHWVEPSSKMDREYRSETEPDPSGDKARQFPEEQRQSIGKPLQDIGSPLKLGSEARSDQAFNRTSLPTAPRSIPVLDTTIKEAGPDLESKPVAAINETIDRSQFVVTTDSGVEIDETINITGSPSGIEPSMQPHGAGAGRELVVEAGSAAEAVEPAVSQAVPAEIETAAGSDEAIESPEAAVEADLAAEADEPAVIQAVSAEMETAAGSDEAIESPEVALEADSALEAVEPATRFDRPSAETPLPEVNDDRAANLRPVPAAGDAREVSVPVTARVDPPKLRDLPQGRPEPQPTEPEVLAPGEPPTPFHVAETTQPQFDVDRLLDRGDQLLALGDVASARLFYRLAAKKGSAKGAMAMGSTYDPVYLERIGFVGARPNPAEAIKWYRQAIDMGDRGAEVQLRELANRLERAAALGDGEAQRILEGAGN